MGTEAETTSLEVYTTGTLVSASGVVTGLHIKNQHAGKTDCKFRSWGYQVGQYTTGLVTTGFVTVHGQSVITSVVA